MCGQAQVAVRSIQPSPYFEISQISPVRIGGVKLIVSLVFVSKQIEQRSATAYRLNPSTRLFL